MGNNGYLYIYTSNQSPQDVYFDDLTVTHTTGPLLQEQSYYPFGLQMSAISDKAINKLTSQNKFNGGVELEEDYGVNLYSTFYRQYDPQIGRFGGVDMLSERNAGMSVYQFGVNNPVSFNDPRGDKETSNWSDFYSSVNHAWRADDFGGNYGNGLFYSQQGLSSGGGGSSFGSRDSWSCTRTITTMQVYSNLSGSGSYLQATYTGLFGQAAGDQYHYTGELQLTSYTFEHFDGSKNNNSGQSVSDESSWTNVNKGIGSFSVGWGFKQEAMEFAVRDYAKLSRSDFNGLSRLEKGAGEVAVLGSGGAKYLKGVKVLGGVAFAASAVISIGSAVNYYNQGGTDNSVGIKAGIDVVMGAVGFLGPIGFLVSSAYFLIDASTDGFGGYGDPNRTPK